MSILTHPAFGPRASLIYITLGVLMDVWTAVWYFAFVRGQSGVEGTAPISNMVWFWLVGLFLTGLTLVTIGLLLGQIGQAARRAEMPPSDVINAEARIQQTAAANPQPAIVTPGNTVSATGQPAMANPPIVVGR